MVGRHRMFRGRFGPRPHTDVSVRMADPADRRAGYPLRILLHRNTDLARVYRAGRYRVVPVPRAGGLARDVLCDRAQVRRLRRNRVATGGRALIGDSPSAQQTPAPAPPPPTPTRTPPPPPPRA